MCIYRWEDCRGGDCNGDDLTCPYYTPAPTETEE